MYLYIFKYYLYIFKYYLYIFKYYLYIFKYYLWQMSILGSAWVLFTRVSFFLDHHHARRRQRRWARYVLFMINYWLLTMTVQYRWQKPTPLHATASRGGFLPTPNHPPPRLQLWDGVGFFLFFKATNDDEPCRLVVVICLRLHPPRQRQ